MFSRSAFQTFVEAFGNVALYGAWFTNEAWVGDSFPTRNEFGLRAVTATNWNHEVENWRALHRAIAEAETVTRALEEMPGTNSARTQLASGWAVLLMAESFCRGTVAGSDQTPGPPLSTDELLEQAVVRLEGAREMGLAGGEEEGREIAWAASVGIARSLLLAGDEEGAAETAGPVPTEFVFELPHADDADHRLRLGNRMWQLSEERAALVVPPQLRERFEAGDPRVPFEDTGRMAHDGELHFHRQMKYPGWSVPSHLTSGLEARYIEVEARFDSEEVRRWVNERRAVGGEAPLPEELSEEELRKELLTQKGLDFWLEGKRMGDLRRHGNDLPWVLSPGERFYKPLLGAVAGQDCWPVPAAERGTNPNWD